MKPRYESQPNPNKKTSAGKLFAYGLGVVAVAAGTLFLVDKSKESDDAIQNAPKIEHTIRSGETLWEIAEGQFTDDDALEDFDVRRLIDDLEAINPNLTTVLQPGDKLDVFADTDNDGTPEYYED